MPTDGSPASAKAIKAGVALAKEMGARVTGCHGVGTARRAGVPFEPAAEGLPFPLRRLLLDVDQRPRRGSAHHAEGNCSSALPGA